MYRNVFILFSWRKHKTLSLWIDQIPTKTCFDKGPNDREIMCTIQKHLISSWPKKLTLDGIDFHPKYRDVSNDCLSFAGCHFQKPKMSAQAYSDKKKKKIFMTCETLKEKLFHRNVTFLVTAERYACLNQKQSWGNCVSIHRLIS